MFGTGDPSYVVKSGIAYLAGSAHSADAVTVLASIRLP